MWLEYTPETLIEAIDTGLDSGINFVATNKSFTEAKLKRSISSLGKTRFNLPLFSKSNIILINLSGGEHSIDCDEQGTRAKWSKLIKEACKDEHTLLIAAVGNDGIELTPTNIVEKGFLPASLHSKSCKDKDFIIRVGATNCYENNEVPKLFMKERELHLGGSNFGKDYVDILAPGQQIPILVAHENHAVIGQGTSEATAIVTATLALMNACKPNVSAKELREALLRNSHKYDSLANAVKDGRVLDIYNIVENFCLGKISPETSSEKIHDEL